MHAEVKSLNMLVITNPGRPVIGHIYWALTQTTRVPPTLSVDKRNAASPPRVTAAFPPSHKSVVLYVNA
jgi:hypothetical protein